MDNFNEIKELKQISVTDKLVTGQTAIFEVLTEAMNNKGKGNLTIPGKGDFIEVLNMRRQNWSYENTINYYEAFVIYHNKSAEPILRSVKLTGNQDKIICSVNNNAEIEPITLEFYDIHALMPVISIACSVEELTKVKENNPLASD